MMRLLNWLIVYALSVSSFLLVIGLLGVAQLGPMAKPSPESAPASTRSLEKIDQWNWHTFGGSGVYLFRVTTCYYVVAFGDNSVAVTHLASCPSLNHRQRFSGFLTGESVHPGDPVIGRPLGDTDFSGVILEDEVKRRKVK
jgi:hypothetical protein